MAGQQQRDTSDETRRVFATVTDADRARGRAKLKAAAERLTPAKRAERRERLRRYSDGS